MLNSYDLTDYVQLPFSYKQFKTDVSDKLILTHVVKWRNDLQNTVGKLRTVFLNTVMKQKVIVIKSTVLFRTKQNLRYK